MAPWIAPENFTSLSLKGETITADEKGEVHLDDYPNIPRADLVEAMQTHGFLPGAEAVPAQEPLKRNSGIGAEIISDDEIAALSRNGLFGYLKARGIKAVPPITNEKLRELIAEARKADHEAAAEAEARAKAEEASARLSEEQAVAEREAAERAAVEADRAAEEARKEIEAAADKSGADGESGETGSTGETGTGPA